MFDTIVVVLVPIDALPCLILRLTLNPNSSINIILFDGKRSSFLKTFQHEFFVTLQHRYCSLFRALILTFITKLCILFMLFNIIVALKLNPLSSYFNCAIIFKLNEQHLSSTSCINSRIILSTF